jgi:hypothetical protein
VIGPAFANPSSRTKCRAQFVWPACNVQRHAGALYRLLYGVVDESGPVAVVRFSPSSHSMEWRPCARRVRHYLAVFLDKRKSTRVPGQQVHSIRWLFRPKGIRRCSCQRTISQPEAIEYATSTWYRSDAAPSAVDRPAQSRLDCAEKHQIPLKLVDRFAPGGLGKEWYPWMSVHSSDDVESASMMIRSQTVSIG